MASSRTYRCPADHAHGNTHTCYNLHKCGCDKCLERVTAASRHVYRQKAYGTFDYEVDACGTRRRLQALVALGWSLATLGERMGVTRQAVRITLKRSAVLVSTRDRVAALYDEMWDTFPDESTVRQRRDVGKTRAFARRNEWAPPLAWDDDEIDNPDAIPVVAPVEPEGFLDRLDEDVIATAIDGDQPKLSPPERRQVVSVLNDRAWSSSRIGAWIGCDKKTVERIRRELELTVPDQRTIRENTWRAAA